MPKAHLAFISSDNSGVFTKRTELSEPGFTRLQDLQDYLGYESYFSVQAFLPDKRFCYFLENVFRGADTNPENPIIL